MALEAVGVASNIAGLVSLGFSVCYGICKYYGSWKDTERDVKDMYISIETLTSSFALLKDLLTRPCFDARIIQRVEESIGLCEDGIECLGKKLKKIQATPEKATGRWNIKAKAQLQRALYPFKESTLVKMREVSNETQSHLHLALEILHVDTSAMSLQALEDIYIDMNQVTVGIKDLNSQLCHTSTKITHLTAAQQDQHVASAHDWLSPLIPDFASKHHESLTTPARQDGLAHRLWNSAEYQQWWSSKGGMLWCLGSRGLGKTVLASCVIENFRRTKPPSTGVAFIYCNYNDPQKQTAINLIGCILQQLMLQDRWLADELSECYENHRKAKTVSSVTEYSSLLRSAAGYFSKTIIVIDALDECLSDTRGIIMEEFGKVQSGLFIIATSRYAMNSSHWPHPSVLIELQANDVDIRKYLEERVGKSQMLKTQVAKNQGLYDYIVSSIVGKARGMFLLARLQLNSVIAKPTLRKIKSALNSLPEELDSMYDQSLERIQNQDPEFAALALKLLSWVHYAVRPLHTQELRHALAVERGDTSFDPDGLPDEDLIESICGGMVTVQKNGLVGLVHYTAQEYLGRKWSSQAQAANQELAHTCLTYLSFDDFVAGPCGDDASFESRCSAYPLLLYASQHWVAHLRIAGEAALKDITLAFLAQKSQLMSSVQAGYVKKQPFPAWSQTFPKPVDGLWLSSSAGLSHICERLLQRGADPNMYDASVETPLHRGAANGFLTIAQLLIGKEAALEAQRGPFGRTPLHCASLAGHLPVVQLLLSKGARAAAQDSRRWTPLHLAAQQGHTEVVTVLLSQEIDVDAADSYNATALYRSAEEGHTEAARLLLDQNAQIDCGNSFSQTALHRAADVGHLEVARLLLERGADFNLKDFYGWTPQYRAADHGHDDVAALLADFADRARSDLLEKEASRPAT